MCHNPHISYFSQHVGHLGQVKPIGMSDAGRLGENQNQQLRDSYGLAFPGEHRSHTRGHPTPSSRCHFPGHSRDQPSELCRLTQSASPQISSISERSPLLTVDPLLLCQCALNHVEDFRTERPPLLIMDLAGEFVAS